PVRTSSPPPERLTVYCFGTNTLYRNGATLSCGPHAGTGSAVVIPCRNTACQLFQRFGGRTRRKQPRRAASGPNRTAHSESSGSRQSDQRRDPVIIRSCAAPPRP